MFWAILALACVAPCVALAAERSVCIPPVLVIPPPGNWPGSPVLQQAQVFLVNGDRLQSSADVCWRGMSNTYNCSLSTLQTPSDDTTDFHIEIGRVYRLTPENDGNILKGNCFLGQLTSRGFFGLITAGSTLASAYVRNQLLLPNTLSAALSCMYLRAYSEEASIASLQGLITGLYPSASGQQYIESVDISTVDQEADYLVPNDVSCGELENILSAAMQDPVFVKHNQTVTAPLVQELAAILELSPQEVDLNTFKECALSTICHQTSTTLPYYLQNDTLLDAVRAEEDWYWGFLTNNANYTACASAAFLNSVKSNLPTLASNGTVNAPLSFATFSGPLYGPVLFMLSSLGLFERIPVFSDVLILETYSIPSNKTNKTTLFVRTIYNSTVVQIPSCKSDSPYPDLCTMDTFLGLLTGFSDIPACQSCQGAQNVGRSEGAFGGWSHRSKRKRSRR